MFLPERRWGLAHVAVLVAGILLCGGVLAIPDRERAVLVGMLSLPILGAIAVRLVRREADPPPPAAYLVAVWFLAALFEALAAQRLVLLLVAPFGILFGVAIGRIYTVLAETLGPHAGRHAWVVHALLLVVPGVVLLPCTRAGVAAARASIPQMNDAWWDTLVRLRDTTPPDAIVSAWWDYGHWIKYVAERPVYVDGSTIATHVTHWFARALLAPTDDETAGLLRMLACGSDATPAPEGELGAWGRLVRYGVDPPTAHEIVIALAARDRNAARAYLLRRGFTSEAADDVLRATHCTPPPIYLVLTSSMAAGRGWPSIGSWDPREDPPARGPSYVAPRWSACAASGASWTCPIAPPTGNASSAVTAVDYRPDAPAETRMRTDRGERAPAALLVAGPERVDDVPVDGVRDAELGVLVDTVRRRVLVGSPALLRSTFTRLMFLDGRFSPAFQPVDDRTAWPEERVRTWKIEIQ